MGAAVQFVGKSAVLKAFAKKDFAKWGLFCGNDLLATYEGGEYDESEQELSDWLAMLRGNTTAIYTLRFYDKSTKTIRPSTDAAGSFKFRVTTEEEQQYQYQAAGLGAFQGVIDKMTDRLEQLEKRLQEPKKEEPEKLETWEKLIDHPLVLAGISKMFNIDPSKFTEPAALAGVPDYSPDDVIAELQQIDPKFEHHMRKLLAIAKSKPDQFKWLLTMLDTIVV